ncbi:MAG: P-II family nitrogen regulator [bacterium]
MKLIKAYIRTYMADKVIHVLGEIRAPRLTAIDIRAMGDEIDPQHLEVSSQHAGTYTTMVKLEIVCANEEVQRIKDIIVENARTGYKGDGIIVVSPVDEAMKIRTGALE